MRAGCAILQLVCSNFCPKEPLTSLEQYWPGRNPTVLQAVLRREQECIFCQARFLAYLCASFLSELLC